MSTLTRKRMLTRANSAARKRQKTVILRGSKPEMKHGFSTISHTGATASNTNVIAPAQGTAVSERIGNKVKCHFIEGIINTAVPARVDLLMPREATATPSYTVNQVADRDNYVLLQTWNFNPSTASVDTFRIEHNLPLGVIVHFNGATGTSFLRNNLILRITTTASATVSGYVQAFYTDN